MSYQAVLTIPGKEVITGIARESRGRQVSVDTPRSSVGIFRGGGATPVRNAWVQVETRVRLELYTR